MRASRLGLILIGLFVSSCHDPMAVNEGTEIIGAVQFTPVEGWREWYAELEECAGIFRPYDAIVWVWADTIIFDGRRVIGLWKRPRTVYILATLPPDRIIGVAKHETLHYLLQWGDHPEPPFGDTGDSAACATNDN